jgi:mannan endo-1,4-beta-mannosidase
MDLYNKQITGNDTYHDVFYSDARVVESYQRYVNLIVSRYKNSKAIFSWELANEPRCNGYPAINSGKCTAATLSQWVKDQSAYIKSIDPQHMVCVG